MNIGLKKNSAFYVNDLAYAALTRANTWKNAAAILARRHPQAENTIKVFRAMMRDNALDAVARVKLARERAA